MPWYIEFNSVNYKYCTLFQNNGMTHNKSLSDYQDDVLFVYLQSEFGYLLNQI